MNSAKRTFIIASLLLWLAPFASATVFNDLESYHQEFTVDYQVLSPSITLPVNSVAKKISINPSTILTRIQQSQQDFRVEPIEIYFDNKTTAIKSVANKIAQEGEVAQLVSWFRSNLKKNPLAGQKGERPFLATIDANGLSLIDSARLGHFFAKSTQRLAIDFQKIAEQPELLSELLSQLSYFLPHHEIENIKSLITSNRASELSDSSILPEFARKFLGRYVPFKGPNCFHAALAFQGLEFAGSENVNIRREEGYHEIMINNDELSRALSSQFYEIDPKFAPLKYGDIIVFFEISDPQKAAADFRTIKHASVFLFNNFVFAKGSKSANSPYVIKIIEEDWKLWTKITDELGAKVFRRGLKRARKSPPSNLSDWIY